MHLAKCFSVLLASGQGRKCQELRKVLQQTLLVRPAKNAEILVLKHKFGQVKDPEGHKKLSKFLARKILPIMHGVDKFFFGIDAIVVKKMRSVKPFSGSILELSNKMPIKIESQNEKQILLFRRLLEMSMSRGLWAGSVGHD